VNGHPSGSSRTLLARKPETAWILDEVGKEYPSPRALWCRPSHHRGSRTSSIAKRAHGIHFPSFLKQFVAAQLADDKLSKTSMNLGCDLIGLGDGAYG